MARVDDGGADAGRPGTADVTDSPTQTDESTQGYAISDDELTRSLDDFRDKYADANGYPKCVCPETTYKQRNADSKPSKDSMQIIAMPSPEMLEKYTPMPPKGASPDAEPQEATIGSILVRFATDPDVRIKQLKDFQKHLHDRNFYSGIYIASGTVTNAVLKAGPTWPIPIEVFREDDLLVNITRHELVPKHILLSPREKYALLTRYRLKETQLPRITYDDPMAMYLRLRRGQVVKIIRKSETAGRYASYRWCI